MEDATSHTIAVEGAEIYVEDRGAGPALLLLHGLTGVGRDFERLFDLSELARRFRVIIPDARGHGRSTMSGVFRFSSCAADVLAILDRLGVETVRAVGLSLGAKTLLHVATRAPSRVQRMVVVSATPRLPEKTRALFRAAASVGRSSEEWTRLRSQHAHGEAQIQRLLATPRELADDLTDMSFTGAELTKISARTLIVSGDRDPFYPVELAVELYRGIPDASLWIVPGALHVPVFLAEKDAFVREALRFLG